MFDFGISSYPTLILTFFYGAFYAKKIATNPTVGTSLWGFALSSASIICFLLLSIILICSKNFIKIINTSFFKFIFYVMIFFTFGLVLFDEGTNQIFPLVFIVISFISFEFINLYYNITLNKISKPNSIGALSNLGWAFGYLGGLVALFLIFLLLKLSNQDNYEILNFSVLLLIGPFVAIWSALFGFQLFNKLKNLYFETPDITKLIKNIKTKDTLRFLVSYFFFNNAVVSIFAFASMIAAFLFGLTESQILFL